MNAAAAGAICAFGLGVGCLAGLLAAYLPDRGNGEMASRVLKKVEARQADDGEHGAASSSDGYYARTAAGAVLGPMDEEQFEVLRQSADVRSVRGAWRVSGGAVYKVHMHWALSVTAMLSEGAMTDCCEMLVVAAVFSGVVLLFLWLHREWSGAVTAEDKRAQKDRELLTTVTEMLFAIALLLMLLTTWVLVKRWRAKTVDIFVSEV